MSSSTTTLTPPEQAESKQVRAVLHDFGCSAVEQTVQVPEIVRCEYCGDAGMDIEGGSRCSQDRDLHERDIPYVGLYLPCPIHGSCGALLTTDRAPVMVLHFDAKDFQIDEDGHRRVDVYPLYPIHNPQTLEEFRKQAAPYKSPLMSTEDVLTLAETGIDYIWDKYLAPGLITFLISAGEIGKTTLTLSLLQHILRGEDFLGRSTRKAKIIYISEEPAKLLAAKIRRLKDPALQESLLLSWYLKGVTKKYKPDKDGNPELQPPDWNTISEVIHDEIHKHHRVPDSKTPVVIVLDTLMSIVAPADMVDPAKVGETMANLRTLATTTEAALLILHHTEKTGTNYLGGVQFRDQCDFMLQLTYKTVKDKGGKYVSVRESPLRLLKNMKHRDEAALIKHLWVEYDPETGYKLPENPPPVPGEKAKTTNEGANEETPGSLAIPGATPAPTEEDIDRQIIALWNQDPRPTHADIAKAVKKAKGWVGERIKTLKLEDKIQG